MDRTGNWEVLDPLEERPVRDGEYPVISLFLHYLAESRLVPSQELERFLADSPVHEEGETALLAESLIHKGLLNRYQLRRILAGHTFGLVLGHYRVLDWLGAGGMGVVYKAEHIHMKRPVALKVLVTEEDDNTVFLQRFSSEMQALAVLRHPNIVLAFDAGEVQFPHRARRVLRYLVMEYVQGQNLEQYVLERGPLPIPLACDFIRQAANGLRHAHEHGLVHRDIKPSNLLVTGLSGPGPHAVGQGQLKILDFGLARLCRRRCTAAYAMLGTVDYMAPEQARDARSVDSRADIYGLGGTLYWLLTGHRPFPSDRPPVEELLARQFETPIPPRQHRPDIPLELEAIVCQMMARDPNDRYPTPLAVVTALNDFLEPQTLSDGSSLVPTAIGAPTSPSAPSLPTVPRASSASLAVAPRPARQVLIVSPDAECRISCRQALERRGMDCRQVVAEDEALRALADFPADLVLVDGARLADEGLEACRQLRAEATLPYLKVVLLLRGLEPPSEVELLTDEQIEAGTSRSRMAARVRAVLRLKEAEERAERTAGSLLATNTQLQQVASQRDHTLQQAQDVLIFSLAKMAELRGHETAAHLKRMQLYSRVLAEEAMHLPALAGEIDGNFVRLLERCVLLHDIGKVAIPDHILLKPGKLDGEERSIMESHTTLGATLLEAVGKQNGSALPFMSMAVSIVRSHHERYDGQGYPDGLMGDAIPLAARIAAFADVYDAMRSTLVYKPGLSHAAVRRLVAASSGQFDPDLLVAFEHCEANFKQIFDQNGD